MGLVSSGEITANISMMFIISLCLMFLGVCAVEPLRLAIHSFAIRMSVDLSSEQAMLSAGSERPKEC